MKTFINQDCENHDTTMSWERFLVLETQNVLMFVQISSFKLMLRLFSLLECTGQRCLFLTAFQMMNQNRHGRGDVIRTDPPHDHTAGPCCSDRPVCSREGNLALSKCQIFNQILLTFFIFMFCDKGLDSPTRF